MVCPAFRALAPLPTFGALNQGSVLDKGYAEPSTAFLCPKFGAQNQRICNLKAVRINFKTFPGLSLM